MAAFPYAVLATATAFSFLAWLVSKILQPDQSLSHIPLVKFKKNNTAKRYVARSRSIVHLGYTKYLKNGQAFRMRNPIGGRDQVILPMKYLDEVGAAPQSRMSFPLFSSQAFLLDYTEAPQQTDTAVHAVKIGFSKNLGQLIKAMHEECIAAYGDTLPKGDGWTSVSPYPVFSTTVARITARVLAGRELCRNREWVRIMVDTTIKVMVSAQIIRFIYPRWLRWLSRWLVSGSRAVSKNRKCAARLLSPIIERRTTPNRVGEEKAIDGVQWLMDAKRGATTARDIADEQLFLSIASIHSSSANMLSIVYDLLEHKEYLEDIMEEIKQTLVEKPEWTKQSLGKLRKLDSFMKESQRIHPVGMVAMQRSAVRNYTFKDGLHIPAGTQMSMPLQELNLDPDIYPSPETFDGYRFLKLRETTDPNKFHYASVSEAAIGFGGGTHACPGRFYASCELKLMLVEFLLRYEVRLEGSRDGKRPKDRYHDFSIIPNMEAKLLVRERREGALVG
ncbi:MAG: hypothetical protein M1839_002855 [Geoglossum umbratile]|nr:MAG: hypothetical protein M1839_002855 [Geoglossum umbratile]